MSNLRTDSMRWIYITGLGGCIAIMGLILALAPFSTPDMFVPDQGVHWYYWKLQHPDFWSRFSAWSLYALHQLGLWSVIAWAQAKRPGYTAALHPVNIAALTLNLVFVLLHIGQTKFFYDGLAQDTHVMSSQFSVIFMLVFILLMENSRRGLFFGLKLNFLNGPGGFLRKYHGYYFSWAIVYTFWFHPIEDTLGHLLGTFYTLMLLMQGSLFFTRAHRNRYWTLLLEAFVVLHGAMVAYLSIQGEMWPMFLFGFLAIFVITQIHGIGLGNRTRWLLAIGYIAAVVAHYWGKGSEWIEVLRIPGAEYALVFICAGVIWLLLMLARRLKPPRPDTSPR
ncbi:hypothetical protein EY643_12975 [Halioglobus maricola]|uniref:Serine active site containing 1-like protein n=1 Tax=Halioglobus maricola TaxID=2601894 RepID=A0A5P9NL42_9GAMM|nr:hypothetical protein [Halioglobus maricola]QFU76497.1 hypothetical protein EY643_12975 [Halioglobus maricola]